MTIYYEQLYYLIVQGIYNYPTQTGTNNATILITSTVTFNCHNLLMRLPNPGEKLPPEAQLKRFKLLIETTYLTLEDIYRILGESKTTGTALYRANYSAYYRKERTADLLRRHSTGRRNPNKRYSGLSEGTQAFEDYLDRYF